MNPEARTGSGAQNLGIKVCHLAAPVWLLGLFLIVKLKREK